jgi:hypothetical protein
MRDPYEDCGGTGRLRSNLDPGFKFCPGCDNPDCPNRESPDDRHDQYLDAPDAYCRISLTRYEARVVLLALRDVNYGGSSSETRNLIRDKIYEAVKA